MGRGSLNAYSYWPFSFLVTQAASRMGAAFSLSTMASIAASLEGWVLATSWACMSPITTSDTEAIIPNIAAANAERLKNSTCCFLRRWYALIPRTNIAATIIPAVMVCINFTSPTGEKVTWLKS